jgi:hypothetical protein
MQMFLRILKEIGIAIVILGLLLLVGFFLFRSSVPFLSSDIPNAVEYKGINYAEYDIEGDLEDQTDPTKRYEATNNNLRGLENERKVQTGAANPFTTSTPEGESDLPTEKVSIENSANPTEQDLANMAIEREAQISAQDSNKETTKVEEKKVDNGEPVTHSLED